MGRENTITVNSEIIGLTDIVKTGRNKFMSLLNFNLNISHFHIDIRVKRDEEKRKEKIRKIIEHEKRLNELMEQRNRIDVQFMRINM
ncbi:hypothetical protein HNQ80_002029 [Anaerosolibacter carboniphilus]|uniref:Uncharacterized protein n=1 Tax=Anaerosolibacter carboniphilus TaxID=1417629 RepID=A0A841KUR1_9FIRM|nr:hypothetical protein [Anaerosolibacter carboniphilus]MBB6215938.1 hypothetical protein [Anaerosolibacter carboniphilus]